MNKLSTAINSFYEAFSDMPKPEVIHGCEHCIDEKDIDTLLSKPLRELSSDDLSSYASSAFLTVGEVDDYLYFLPRILELSIRDEQWWPDVEVTGRTVKSADLDSWPETRRRAMTNLLSAIIQDLVDTPNGWRIDEWMCAIGRMGLDVRSFLSIIEENDNAVLEYWKVNADKLDNGVLSNAFWELPNEQHDKIVRWFQSAKINLIYAEEYGYRTS